MAPLNIRQGAEVRSADGEKLGKVTDMQGQYVVVEKGFFFPTDYYVPTSAIARADDATIYLSVGKDQALASGWDRAPTADTTGATSGDAAAAGEGALRVPVHEEELTATTRPVERGAVRVDKDVVAEERSMDVPVTEERVRVTRRAVDRAGVAGDTAFQEETIEVPVRGEAVDVQKRARVAEEVEITKEAVQGTQRVEGTVRREQVRVEDATTGTGPADDAPQAGPTA